MPAERTSFGALVRPCTAEKKLFRASPRRVPRAFAAFRLATIYLPQFLLLKWVVVKYSGVPLPVAGGPSTTDLYVFVLCSKSHTTTTTILQYQCCEKSYHNQGSPPHANSFVVGADARCAALRHDHSHRQPCRPLRLLVPPCREPRRRHAARWRRGAGSPPSKPGVHPALPLPAAVGHEVRSGNAAACIARPSSSDLPQAENGMLDLTLKLSHKLTLDSRRRVSADTSLRAIATKDSLLLEKNRGAEMQKRTATACIVDTRHCRVSTMHNSMHRGHSTVSSVHDACCC